MRRLVARTVGLVVAVLVSLVVLTGCNLGVSAQERAFEECVENELAFYQDDPYWEYEGNEDMYTAMAEGECE